MPEYESDKQHWSDIEQSDPRAMRLGFDYLKPELSLQKHGIKHTIVVFGSARIVEPSVARRNHALALKLANEHPDDPVLQQSLRTTDRIRDNSKYYDAARELGRLVGESGHGPDDSRVVITTGGGPGIMEAANRGASDTGANSVGLNIQLPLEQQANPYITPNLSFSFHYFALRKLHFLHRARALVAFPGGYGTFDELFETLTLVQTGKIKPLPIILVGRAFWSRAVNFEFLVDEGVISPRDKELFSHAETGPEIWDSIVDWHRVNGQPLF